MAYDDGPARRYSGKRLVYLQLEFKWLAARVVQCRYAARAATTPRRRAELARLSL